MEQKTILIRTPDKTVVRAYVPKEYTDNQQTVLNYLHRVIDEAAPCPFHRLEQLMAVPQVTLDKYGLRFEQLPDEIVLDLGRSRIMPYNAYR